MSLARRRQQQCYLRSISECTSLTGFYDVFTLTIYNTSVSCLNYFYLLGWNRKLSSRAFDWYSKILPTPRRYVRTMIYVDCALCSTPRTYPLSKDRIGLWNYWNRDSLCNRKCYLKLFFLIGEFIKIIYQHTVGYIHTLTNEYVRLWYDSCRILWPILPTVISYK